MNATPLKDADVVSTANAAGLQKALERFPDEVLVAARAAAQARKAFSPPDDPTSEPCPPMRVRSCV
jgi:hypothetical protein